MKGISLDVALDVFDECTGKTFECFRDPYNPWAGTEIRNFEDMSTLDVNEAIIKPRLRESGCSSYIQHVQKREHSINFSSTNEAPLPSSSTLVGKATVYIIHSWRYRFIHVVEALRALPIDEFLFFDLFCIDQFSSSSREVDFWTREMYQDAIVNIGHSLLIWTNSSCSWGNLLPLKCTKCLYELYLTSKNECVFEVVMTAEEIKACRTHLINDGSLTYLKMLEDIRIEKADSYMPKDMRTGITEEIRALEEGEINRTVREHMRKWVIESILTVPSPVATVREDADRKKSLANVLIFDNHHKDSDMNQALELYQEVLSIYTNEDPAGNDVAQSYHGMGNVFKYQNNYEEALKYYEMELNIRKQKDGTDNPAVASLYSNIAIAHKNMDNTKKAIGYWELSIDIYKTQLGPDHPEIANAYECIANVHDDKGDYEKALKYYTLSVEILAFLFGEESIDVARLYNNMVSR